jgi:hypothetical protein
MSAVDQLVAYWSAQQLPLAKGVPEVDVRTFEVRHGITLPSDFREYLARLNGHVQRGGVDVDREGFAFWPLERIQPLPLVCSETAVPIPPVERPECYFVFADYLQWSWAYAIRLGPTNNAIIFVGAGNGEVIADSFTEFVRLYVVDSPALYPTPTEQS